MPEKLDGMTINERRKFVQARMNETGLVTRLIEYGITPKLARGWCYMADGTPTVDIGIRFEKFLADNEYHVVGMYHIPTGRILVSRVAPGPDGVFGLTKFAHQMDECESADDFYAKLDDRLATLEELWGRDGKQAAKA